MLSISSSAFGNAHLWQGTSLSVGHCAGMIGGHQVWQGHLSIVLAGVQRSTVTIAIAKIAAWSVRYNSRAAGAETQV
jgi:hypothetical protein